MIEPTEPRPISGSPFLGKRIAVVIPAYKVEAHIESVIRGMPSFISDIIVVDDASPDRSGAIARGLQDPKVHLIVRDANGGVGAAVMTGYREALRLGVDIVLKIDGDGQMDPSYAIDLVEPIVYGRADYTKGNRFIYSRHLTQMPFRRRLGNMGLSFLTKASSGFWEVFDPTNGYTAVSAAALEALDWERVHPRYFFETSMLIELNLARAVVQDVFIPARYGDERSSLSEWRALLEFPGRLLSGFLRRIWLEYFVKEFSPVALFLLVGLPLALFGMVWGTARWIQSGLTGVEASTGTVMIAVLPLILGVQFLLQAIVIDIQNPPRSPLTNRRRRPRTEADIQALRGTRDS